MATENEPPPSSAKSAVETRNPKTSPRKLASARANGAKSKGPKTAAGLAKCTTAASLQITHGMLARTIIIPGESEPLFRALLTRLINRHHPATEEELDAVRRMAVATWRQLRVWSFQSLDMAREIARQDPSDAAAPAPLRASLAFRTLCLDEAQTQPKSHRYEIMYERQYYMALKILRDLKLRGRDATTGLTSTDSFVLGSTWEIEPTVAVLQQGPNPIIETIPENI